jgi:hypothetical protein
MRKKFMIRTEIKYGSVYWETCLGAMLEIVMYQSLPEIIYKKMSSRYIVIDIYAIINSVMCQYQTSVILDKNTAFFCPHYKFEN